MIAKFGHHLIPLFPLPGGTRTESTNLGTVKEACRSATRIDRALALAGRYEIAVVPDSPDFFYDAPRLAKSRTQVWSTIRDSSHLHWTVLTRYPSNIQKMLPSTWVGNGFENICLGLVVDGREGFSDSLYALLKAPCRYRMLLLTSDQVIEHAEQLNGIHWVVFAGAPDERQRAVKIEAICREVNVAFRFHQTDGVLDSSPISDFPDSWPTHPFGPKFDLSRPALQNMKRPDSTNLIPREPADARSESPTDYVTGCRERLPDFVSQTSIGSLRPPNEITSADAIAQRSTEVFSELGNPEFDDFMRLDGVVRKGLDTFIEVGQALMEIRERELWRAGSYASWAAYCLAYGLTKIHGNRLIKGSEVASNLAKMKPAGFTCLAIAPRCEWQVRPLHRLQNAEQQAAAWYSAVKIAGGQPTESMVTASVKEVLGEKLSAKEIIPNRKQVMIDTFGRVREAVCSKLPHKEIELRLSELGRLLRLA